MIATTIISNNSKQILLCIFLGFIVSFSSAQHTNFNTQRNWALHKKEVFFGGGTTLFTGDLGGINKPGANYKLRDFSFPSTGWSGVAGYRYRFHPFWATTSKIQLGQLQGNDALKIDTYQNSRNLHFKSFFVQLSQRIDMVLLANEVMERRYSLRKRSPILYRTTVFTGLGLIYNNPKAKYNGSWVDLHPLKTEGQGLSGGSKAYSRVTAAIPVGVSFVCAISRMWRMGLELEYNFSFSDYLDDVGGNYYDPNQLADEFGEASAYLSNPSTQNTDWFTTGQVRGNDKLDGFFSLALIFCKNATFSNYTRKKEIESQLN